MNELQIIGLDAALKKLEHLQQPHLDKASQKVVMAAARSLVMPIKREGQSSFKGHGNHKKYGLAPGNLVRAVTARRGKKTLHPSAIVGPRAGKKGAYYRHMVIGGTTPHTIRAKRGPLSWPGVFAWEVAHPGSRANSFVERGVAGQERRIDEFVARALEKELRL